MNEARVAGQYADLNRLPGLTGSQIQRQMATMKARLIARYRLTATPGRPEELVQSRPILNGPIEMGKPVMVGEPGHTVSLGYGCGTVRVRKHGGEGDRVWIDTRDVLIREGWHAEVYEFLDQFFGYVDPKQLYVPKNEISDRFSPR